MFSRNKNTPQIDPQSVSAAHSIVDGVATAPAETHESASPARDLGKEGRELYELVDQRYQDFTKEAAEHSLSQQDLEASLVDAWNADALPKLIPSEPMTSTAAFWVLKGKVPADLFDHYDRQAEGEEVGAYMPGVSEYFPRGGLCLPLGFLSYDGNQGLIGSDFSMELVKVPRNVESSELNPAMGEEQLDVMRSIAIPQPET